MGLKIAELFRDYCLLTVTATGARATLLADVTCQVYDEAGVAFGAAIIATETANGWYYAEFTPDAAGTWTTEWSKTANPEDYTFHYPYKEFQVGAGQEADIYTRLGAPAGASVSADILVIDNFVDDLETRLTAARAGYLDELAAANLPTDVATVGALHNVPGQDAAPNVILSQVVGNKTDTVAGTSLVAIAKQIKAKTDNLPADPADDSDLDTSIAAVKAETALIVADTNELQTDLHDGGRLDLLVDAIKAKTDNLPVDPGDQSAIVAEIDANEVKIDAVKAETALIVADTGELQTDLHDGGRLDLLVDAIKAKTDNLPADPADDSDLDTSIAAVKAETALIVADSGELQTDWVNGGRLDLLIDAIKARTDNRLQAVTFFSPYQALVTLDTTHTDAALPTVTIPNWTGTVVHVYAGMKWDWVDNTKAAANKLSGVQEIQINKAGGAWTDAINFVDDMFSLPASTLRAGGSLAMGIIDLVGTIDVFNTTAQFQWDEPLTDQDSILLYNVQTFVTILYY